MGYSERGPIPKRSDQKAGHRSAEELAVTKAAAARDTSIPEPNPRWHPLAKSWYLSLAASGQNYFYEPSDWTTALLLAEHIHREMSPKPLVLRGAEGMPDTIEWVEMPMLGASLNAFLKGCTDLMVTEAGRRRASIELQRGESTEQKIDERFDALVEGMFT